MGVRSFHIMELVFSLHMGFCIRFHSSPPPVPFIIRNRRHKTGRCLYIYMCGYIIVVWRICQLRRSIHLGIFCLFQSKRIGISSVWSLDHKFQLIISHLVLGQSVRCYYYYYYSRAASCWLVEAVKPFIYIVARAVLLLYCLFSPSV